MSNVKLMMNMKAASQEELRSVSDNINLIYTNLSATSYHIMGRFGELTVFEHSAK